MERRVHHVISVRGRRWDFGNDPSDCCLPEVSVQRRRCWSLRLQALLCWLCITVAGLAHAAPTVAWTAVASGTPTDVAAFQFWNQSIALDGSGNAYVTGYFYDGIGYDFLTIKYDANGVERWRAIAN